MIIKKGLFIIIFLFIFESFGIYSNDKLTGHSSIKNPIYNKFQGDFQKAANFLNKDKNIPPFIENMKEKELLKAIIFP
ncbi:MAG: hypothetical protein ABEH43_04035 [Flavobacteriales bacterium]